MSVVTTLDEAIRNLERDARVQMFLRTPDSIAFFRSLPWVSVPILGRNVIGPLVSLDKKDLLRTMAPPDAVRAVNFVFVQDGRVMGVVMAEMVMDYMGVRYRRFESRQTFNSIALPLMQIFERNSGRPIRPEDIKRRFEPLRPIFSDFDRLLEVLYEIACGTHFRLQIIDL